jgi:hypothetical protein
MRLGYILFGFAAVTAPWSDAAADGPPAVVWKFKVTSVYRKDDGSSAERVTALSASPAGSIPTMSSWSCRHSAPTRVTRDGKSVEYMSIDCDSGTVKATVVNVCGLTPHVGFVNAVPLSVGDKNGPASDVVEVICSVAP